MNGIALAKGLARKKYFAGRVRQAKIVKKIEIGIDQLESV